MIHPNHVTNKATNISDIKQIEFFNLHIVYCCSMYLGAMIILKKQTEVTFFLCPLVLKIMTYERTKKKQMKKGLGFLNQFYLHILYNRRMDVNYGSLGIIQVANFPRVLILRSHNPANMMEQCQYGHQQHSEFKRPLLRQLNHVF